MTPILCGKPWKLWVCLQRKLSLQNLLAWKSMMKYVWPIEGCRKVHFSQQLLHLWLKNFPIVLACLVKAMWRIIIRNLEFTKILLLFRLCLKRRSLNIFWNSVPTRPLVWMAFLLDWFIRDSASIVTVPITHIINLSVITKIGMHGFLVKEKW